MIPHPMLGSNRRKNNIWLFAIVCVALAVRATWAAMAVRFDPLLLKDPLYGDASGYQVLALNLLGGHGLSWDGLHPTSYRMPGYPAFLALVYSVLGQDALGVRVAQALLGSLLCVPVYFLARALVGRNLALCAALGTALFPTLIYMTGWLYSETLYITILWCGLLFVGLAMTRPRTRFAVLGGVLLGLGLMIRPEIAVFPMFHCIIGLLMRWPVARLKVLLLVQACMLAIALPWAVRNTLAHGSPVLLTTSGGSNFYAGNNPRADGGSAWVFPLESMSEVESDRELMHRAQDWIANNPATALALLPQKAMKFFAPLERETGGALDRLSAWINPLFAVFLGAAAVGYIRHRANPLAVLAVGLILWYLLIALVFYGGSRVALPVAPAFVLLACAAVRRGDAPLTTSLPVSST